jgi:hypothetical protein
VFIVSLPSDVKPSTDFSVTYICIGETVNVHATADMLTMCVWMKKVV